MTKIQKSSAKNPRNHDAHPITLIRALMLMDNGIDDELNDDYIEWLHCIHCNEPYEPHMYLLNAHPMHDAILCY
jgi:hypothetical protein